MGQGMVFSQLFKRKPRADDLARKKQVARHGSNLKKLKDLPEWADLLLVKERFQEDSGMQAVNALSDDKSRVYAAVQYTTLHNFFLEISRRIEAGERAQEELKEMIKEK